MPLFDIVKSMSVAEKRHFKMYVGSSGKDKLPKYVELFDILNKQTELDETALTKAGFVPTDKSFLQERIEESLHIQHLGKNVDSKLKWLSESMGRFCDKKHWTELRKCIKKAKQLAKEHERFLDWLQAIQWEKELLVKTQGSKKFHERYEEIVTEEAEVRQRLNEEIDYQNLRIQIDTLRLKDFRLNKLENRQKFEQIIQLPILQNEMIPLSLKAQANYFHSKSVIALFNKQLKEAYRYAQQLVGVFEGNELFRKKHLLWYKLSLCLLAQIIHFSGKNRDIPMIINKIESINIGDKEELKTVCLYGMLYAIKYLDKEKGKEYISKIDTLIKEDEEDIRDGRKLVLFYNIVVFHSIFNNWHEVSQWLSKILTYKRTDDRRDVQYAARILSLVNHYELESSDMDNHIQAVAKYLKSNQQYTETNRYILQAFRDLCKAINRKEQQPIWQGLQDFLDEKMTEQNLSNHQLGLEELQIWSQAKLQNTIMAEIIRKEL